MSSVIDVDVEVLELLDFAPSCGFPTGEAHPAEVALKCRSCAATQLLCVAHVDWLRAQMAKSGRRNPITCLACGAQARKFDDIADVVPL